MASGLYGRKIPPITYYVSGAPLVSRDFDCLDAMRKAISWRMPYSNGSNPRIYVEGNASG